MSQRKPGLLDVDWSSHPELGESLIPVYGSAREAIADYQDGDYWGAAGNGLLAITDVIPAGAAGKVAFKVAKATKKAADAQMPAGEIVRKGLAPALHLNKSSSWGSLTSQMKRDGRHIPDKEWHHWAIPQNGWGRAVPERIKNQPWNIKALDKADHRRIHGSWAGKPRFNPITRTWHGTPAWAKGAAVSAGGRLVPDKER